MQGPHVSADAAQENRESCPSIIKLLGLQRDSGVFQQNFQEEIKIGKVNSKEGGKKEESRRKVGGEGGGERQGSGRTIKS